MSNAKKSSSSLGEVTVGLSLLFPGAFVVVLMVFWMFDGPPQDQATGTQLPALYIARAIGALPAAVIGLGCAILGGRLFLMSKGDDLGRHFSGILGVSVGLSVLLGAMSDTWGGGFGAALGGSLGPILGFLLGIVLLGGMSWFVWLKDIPAISRRIAVTAPSSSALTEDLAGGVTIEEAEALVPDPVELANPYPEDVRLEGKVPEGAAPLESEGTYSLDEAVEPSADTIEDASVYRWTPGDHGSSEDLADEDLVSGEPADRAPHAESELEHDADETRLEAGALTSEPSVEPLDARGAQPLTNAYTPPRPSWERSGLFEEEELLAAARGEGELSEEVEAPEQAQADVLEGEPAAELALAEEASEDRAELEDEPEEEESEAEVLAELDAEGEEDEEYEEEDEDEDLEEEPEEAESETCAELDEDEDEDEEYEEEDEELEEEEVLAELDEDEEEEDLEEEPEEAESETYAELDEDEDEEEDEYEEEYEEEEEDEEEEVLAELDEDEDEGEDEEEYEEEPEEEESEVYAEADEADEGDDDDEEEYEDEEEELEEEDSEVYAEVDEDEGEEEDEEYEEEPEEEELLAAEPEEVLASEEPAEEPTAAEPTTHAPVQMDLFADPDDAPATAEPEPARAEASEEPEVILQPQAPDKPESAWKVPTGLLVDAGNLFIQSDRVAVSMLQKNFGLDFDQSCEVLDELQQLGLIGPYLGGNSREILMSAPEWQDLVGQP